MNPTCLSIIDFLIFSIGSSEEIESEHWISPLLTILGMLAPLW